MRAARNKMVRSLAETPGRNADLATMLDRIHQLDWGHTPLGVVSRWSERLSSAASVILNSSLPMCLIWGETRVAVFNEAYRPLLGSGQPALGKPLPDLCGDAWELARPAVE
jgi:hypothetical protein